MTAALASAARGRGPEERGLELAGDPQRCERGRARRPAAVAATAVELVLDVAGDLGSSGAVERLADRGGGSGAAALASAGHGQRGGGGGAGERRPWSSNRTSSAAVAVAGPVTSGSR